MVQSGLAALHHSEYAACACLAHFLLLFFFHAVRGKRTTDEI
jgi:hypothetical protein